MDPILLADAGPIIILLLISMVAVMFVISRIKRSRIKRRLSAKNFKSDHFWHMVYDYLALDLNDSKIAIGGAVPAQKKWREGIYELSKVVGARSQDPTSYEKGILIVVADDDLEMTDYVVSLHANTHWECLKTLQELGIQAPDELDIAYIETGEG